MIFSVDKLCICTDDAERPLDSSGKEKSPPKSPNMIQEQECRVGLDFIRQHSFLQQLLGDIIKNSAGSAKKRECGLLETMAGNEIVI